MAFTSPFHWSVWLTLIFMIFFAAGILFVLEVRVRVNVRVRIYSWFCSHAWQCVYLL